MTTIKALREAAGMTQKEFSDYFCIPYRTVQSWNAGVRMCPDYLIELLAYKLKAEGLLDPDYT